MINKDEKKRIREELLNDFERKVFILFLEHERLRHYEDIHQINLDIHELLEKNV